MTVKKKRIIALAVVAAILLALIIWMAWGNTALQLNTYTISSERLPETFDGYRIAHVSDLHTAELGNDNEKLLDMLSLKKEDITTEDIISPHANSLSFSFTLIFFANALKLSVEYGNPLLPIAEHTITFFLLLLKLILLKHLILSFSVFNTFPPSLITSTSIYITNI